MNLAGEEGFEPPLSVLETDGLPLNLLPYLEPAAQDFNLSPHSGRRVNSAASPDPEQAPESLNFFMPRMLPASIAKLRRLQPVLMLLPVLRCRIVPVLAVVAL